MKRTRGSRTRLSILGWSSVLLAACAGGMRWSGLELDLGTPPPAATAAPARQQDPVAQAPLPCAQCHKLRETRYVHGPVASGECHQCHGTARPESIHQTVPPAGNESCSRCHTGPTFVTEAKHRPYGKQECSSCHEPHASDQRYFLAPEPTDPPTDEPSPWVSVESGTYVMQACLGCHEKSQTRPDGSVVAALDLPSTDGPLVHGPIREGDCIGCHVPHHSEEKWFLRGEYPTGIYADYDPERYGLCFRCHDPAAFTTARTTDLTNFRDGDRNLHDLHVNRETMGRTCRACHLTHSSEQEHLIRSHVPFNKWVIALKYEQRPSGGSCAPNCHLPETYDRVASPLNRPGFAK